MEQDLFNWLNSSSNNAENSNGTGLLLAPINDERKEIRTETQEIQTEIEQAAPEIEIVTDVEPEVKTEVETLQEHIKLEQVEQPESVQDYEPDTEPESVPEPEPEQEAEPEQIQEPEAFTEQPEQLQEQEQTETEQAQEPEFDPAKQSLQWQEAATGFELSLNDPPPEIWTHINSDSTDNDEDDEEEEYVQGTSLQDPAYIQIHGRNFTQRLQYTLKQRKERAKSEHVHDEDKEYSHPFILKSVLLCMTMLIVLLFSCLVLYYLQRQTPEGMNAKALSLHEQGKFEEAENLWRNAYRRYPNVLTFLKGLAESAEKAGHVQTAKTAWETYINSLPKDDNESRDIAQRELRRLNGESGKKTEDKNIEIKQVTREVKPVPEIKIFPNDETLTFSDYLNEGNNAYNIGMYNRAVTNFFKAMEINSYDIRPYIGLASSYKMKGMYFDSFRILDEARRKFRRNPTIDMGLILLKKEGN